jgi:hypothetical protein
LPWLPGAAPTGTAPYAAPATATAAAARRARTATVAGGLFGLVWFVLRKEEDDVGGGSIPPVNAWICIISRHMSRERVYNMCEFYSIIFHLIYIFFAYFLFFCIFFGHFLFFSIIFYFYLLISFILKNKIFLNAYLFISKFI